MANELTRQLQLRELEILIELDRVCKEENLTYFLEGGTLLGALRHGGFIPWDDDIDVLMPREDYNRLIDNGCRFPFVPVSFDTSSKIFCSAR